MVNKDATGNDAKQLLTAKDCFFMAMGATIGAGIITNTGIAIGIAGTGVVIAYILAFTTYYVGHFPLIIMSSIKPVYSCHYVYTQWLGQRLAGVYMYIFLIGRVSQAFMGIAFGTYLASIVDIPPAVGGIAVLTLLYVINLLGMKSSARLQNVITAVLILAIVSFVFLGLPKVNYDAFFLKENLFFGGAMGMFNAIAILLFGTGGAFLILPMGPKIIRPETTIPRVVSIAQVCACLLFCAVAFVGAGVGPLSEVAGQPMTYQALIIYPGNWYLLFVIGGALLAIITTINANYIYYYTSMLKGCEDGWMPRWFAKLNRNGVPHRLLTLFWLIAVIPLALGMDLGQLVSVAAALTLAQTLVPLWGLVKLPALYPELWAKSRFYMPTPFLYVLTGFCTALLLTFIVINFVKFSLAVLVAVLLLIALSIIIVVVFGKQIVENNDKRKAEEALTAPREAALESAEAV